MQKSELVQRFEAFLQQPNQQNKDEVGLAYYLAWYFVHQASEPPGNYSIIPGLPHHIANAMKYLRESNDPQISKFRHLYLAARGQHEVPDLTAKSWEQCVNEVLPTVSLVARLMSKVTGDNAVGSSIETPYIEYIQLAIAAERNCLQANRRYLIAEVEAARKQIAFIQKGFHYITVCPFFDRNGTPPQEHYLLQIDRIKTLENPGALPSNPFMNPYFSFSSWEKAASCYCHMFQHAWFRVENTLRNSNWWQQQRMSIQCTRSKYRKQEKSFSRWNDLWQSVDWGTFQDDAIIEFDTWVPKPGIERTWYTDAMLEAELNRKTYSLYDGDRQWSTGHRLSGSPVEKELNEAAQNLQKMKQF